MRGMGASKSDIVGEVELNRQDQKPVPNADKGGEGVEIPKI